MQMHTLLGTHSKVCLIPHSQLPSSSPWRCSALQSELGSLIWEPNQYPKAQLCPGVNPGEEGRAWHFQQHGKESQGASDTSDKARDTVA